MVQVVETWKNDSGQEFEVLSGYNEEWTSADGRILLTMDHGFNPNTLLEGTWSALKKQVYKIL